MVARLAAILILLAGLAGTARAQDGAPLTPRQVQDVQQIIRSYLTAHPEIIANAMEALREKMQAQAAAATRQAISAHKTELFDDGNDPIAGNPKGDVTIVEFFDYNCVYCRASTKALLDAVKADGDVKVVYKELPILTPSSVVDSRMALAAMKQGKYEALHRAFMAVRGLLDAKMAYGIARGTGLDMARLKKDMKSAAVTEEIRRNKELASALGIDGTPTFVIGDMMFAQALDAAQFTELFHAARADDKVGSQSKK